MLWSRDDRWKALIVADEGVEVIDEACGSGRGVLVLVPHFGNWEILNLYLGARYGLTALYDPPRIRSFDAIVCAGRTRTGSVLVPVSGSGIRALYAALKSARVVALLPDQVPPVTAGEYAPFFDRPALTMTFVHRLSVKLRPRLVIGHARRLPDGAGFSLGFEGLSDLEVCNGRLEFLSEMNRAIERVVATDPAQYQWEYKRFKRPKHPSDRIY
jgi:KDO2-lipid IV(A) lauroyltransferase